MSKKRTLYFTIALVLLAGCAATRKQKMAAADALGQAEDGLRASDQAAAAFYAPVDYERAQSLMLEARNRFARKKYKETVQLANDAAALARQAEQEAMAEQERREEAERRQRLQEEEQRKKKKQRRPR